MLLCLRFPERTGNRSICLVGGSITSCASSCGETAGKKSAFTCLHLRYVGANFSNNQLVVVGRQRTSLV